MAVLAVRVMDTSRVQAWARDPFVRALAVCYALTIACYALLSPPQLRPLANHYIELVLLALLTTAFALNTYRAPLRARAFWSLLACWTGAWIVARGYAWIVGLLGIPWAAPQQLTSDLLYLVSYIFLLLSPSAVAGPTGHRSRARFRRQLVERAALAVLGLGLIAYLIVIPLQLDQGRYVERGPSMLLYATLDAVAVAAFLRLAMLRPRAQFLYGSLAAGMVLVLIGDLLATGYRFGLIAPLLPGRLLDFVWYIPVAPLLIAARYAAMENYGPVERADVVPGTRRALVSPPPALYVAVLLLLHFSTEDMEIWSSIGRSVHSTLAFWLGLTLLGLDSLRQRELDTERLESDQRQRRSESRYRLLFDNSLTANYVTRPDGEVLACNESFARLFGFASTAEAREAKAVDLYERADDRQEALDAIRREGRLAAREWDMQRADGQPLRVLENAVAIFNGGELTEIHGQLVNVTERQALEEQLRHAVKLEAVGQLAGGMAHDFNNVLTAVQGYAQLIEQEPDDVAQVRADAERIRSIVAGAAEVTQQLLAFSRRQPLRSEILDINSVVSGVEVMVTRLIGEHIHLRSDLADDLPRVSADRAQLERVLVNLVVNARDAMPAGGDLVMSTERFRDPVPYEVDPGWVTIHVCDTGRGMTSEELEHAFEPFFTTKERGRGTGLGLSTVYGIVEQHGGKVLARSVPGEGTRISILLPGTAAAATATAPLVDAREAAGVETILIVEDEAAVREVAVRSLVARGYEVLAANGPEEAQQMFRDRTDVDLLLTDVVMPGMSGVDLYRRLSPAAPALRVLYMSGYVDTALLDGYAPGELSPLLAKPFGLRDVASAVRAALDA